MDTPAEAAKSEAAKQAVILLFMMAGMIAVMAVQDPDFLRTLRMRLAAASSRLLDVLAHHTGHSSMGVELATGKQSYNLPYRLSLLRDKCRRFYYKE